MHVHAAAAKNVLKEVHDWLQLKLGHIDRTLFEVEAPLTLLQAVYCKHVRAKELMITIITHSIKIYAELLIIITVAQ